jgi:hypothetical protein
MLLQRLVRRALRKLLHLQAWCWTMDNLYTFKCKRFRNARRTNIWSKIVKLFLKHPALPVEVTLNHDYLR